MLTVRVIVFFAIAIVSNWAKIPYDEVKANIFDSKLRDFELNVLNSTEMTTDFFARKDVLLAIAAGKIAIEKYFPYVGQFLKLLPLMHDTLEDRSEWRDAFSKAIADETKRVIAESESRWMEAAMQTIQEKFILLGDKNPDLSNRKTIASIIHGDLDTMINFFEMKTCLFKKYPLIGTPPLILLASLVAMFSPIAQTLIPMEAKNPQIACKMHDVLMEYRSITVNARLQQLRAEKSIFPSLLQVMSWPYNPHGYNKTNPGVIDCKIGCKSIRTLPFELCLKDEFSANEYHVENNGRPTCVEDYAAWIRHRVERLFPVELLNSLCIDRESEKPPTGSGWLTINIHHVYAHCRADGTSCNFLPNRKCDSFIKLFINELEVLKTVKQKNHESYNPYITFTTERIPKNSTIRIEIWDKGAGFWKSDALIQRTEGNVESFLNKPLRNGGNCSENHNSIETMSFWSDEFIGAEWYMRMVKTIQLLGGPILLDLKVDRPAWMSL